MPHRVVSALLMTLLFCLSVTQMSCAPTADFFPGNLHYVAKKLDLDDEYGMTSPIQTFTIYLGRDRPYSILS